MTGPLPAVSCLCLTYGRPSLLEEAIACFLQQDYSGPKELVILNDYPGQTLRFEHPEVRVVNLPWRFRTVGEKMNVAAALCAHDLVFVWDDDDLYLPRRISYSVERFDPRQGFFTTRHGWMLNDNIVSGPLWNVFHSGACWARELFDLVRGYAAMGNGYDQEIESRFEDARPGSTAAHQIQPDDIFYIYRWAGTGSFHMSGWGVDEQGREIEYEEAARFVERQVASGTMPLGEIVLRPHLRADYGRLVRAHLRTLATPV
jgi:glycosyltransferase involved in cell wall biosynthesis